MPWAMQTAGRALWVGLLALSTVASALSCGSLRQNLRNEFLSFRGVWYCAEKGCDESEMQRATQGHAEGETRVSHCKVQPAVSAVFSPGTTVQTFTARLEDCKGKSLVLDSERVAGPGDHAIGSESDSWVVRVRKKDLKELTVKDSGGCSIVYVKANATFEKGTTYEAVGGIQVE